uniref:Uncharacterized protein n=1 Tax=Rhizophora mucronata TaxID=61149 RepID=A0A2P2IVL0_RHIMU
MKYLISGVNHSCLSRKRIKKLSGLTQLKMLCGYLSIISIKISNGGAGKTDSSFVA